MYVDLTQQEERSVNIKTLMVDFSKKAGKIKPMHGLSSGTRKGGALPEADLLREFSEIGVPVVRLHDAEHPYGSNQFVDIHCIFPNFELDPDDPESYNFAPTDEYITSIKQSGADIIFRLGESTDLFPRTLFTKAPADLEKWASVCEHIIAHYNEKWADGFKYNLRRFEIFGGADDPQVYSGADADFFELYTFVSNRIREKFPRIKIGAYGVGGFYAMNRLTSSESQKRYISFLRSFLKHISSEQASAPLDFLTWYCYPASAEELLLHAKFSRTLLDEYGFRRTSSIICYNTASFMNESIDRDSSYVSDIASLIIVANRSDADTGILTASPKAVSHKKLFFESESGAENCPAYHVLSMYGELYKLVGAVETVGDVRSELYSAAATNGESFAVMIASRSFTGNMELRISGADISRCRIRRIRASAGTMAVSSAEGELVVNESKVLFRVDGESVYLLTMH